MQPDSPTNTHRCTRLTRRSFLKGTVGAIAATGGLGAWGHWIEPERLTLTDRAVSLPDWPAANSGLKVGLLSDLHCDCDQAEARVQAAVRLLLARMPDIVFLAGDFITTRPTVWAARCADALAPLTAVPRGVFAVPGNHDYWSAHPELVFRCLRRAGITVLRNESAPLPSTPGVWIVGLDDMCEERQDITKALHNVPEKASRLLLIHEPDYADEAPIGFSLQLSGHSHGGQVRIPGLPPFYTPRYARRYPAGLQSATHHLVYTSRGLGVGPRFRLFCPPEVALLRLYSSSSRELASSTGRSRKTAGNVDSDLRSGT